LAIEGVKVIGEKIGWADVVSIGCGLSRNKETMELVRTVIRRTDTTTVIDADGLFALTDDLALLKKRREREIILTPHLGEFSRLMKVPATVIERRKFELSRAFSKKYGITLVLKGSSTLICDSRGTVFVNPTGNPGMSTAGSGDVLAGMISALTGQGCTAEAAAVCGVYLHGKAGDIAAVKEGIHGMIASDLIKHIPAAFISTRV
jgi:NAD(P)H-hydrate epimerase